jgi:hypothetical protein
MIISFTNHGDNQIQYKFVEDGVDIFVSPIHELLPGCSLNVHNKIEVAYTPGDLLHELRPYVQAVHDMAEARHDVSGDVTQYGTVVRTGNLLKRLDKLLKV